MFCEFWSLCLYFTVIFNDESKSNLNRYTYISFDADVTITDSNGFSLNTSTP